MIEVGSVSMFENNSSPPSSQDKEYSGGQLPDTWENCDNAAPINIPDIAAMGEVSAWVQLERMAEDRWNQASIDRVSQAVEKNEKQHRKRWVKRL